MTRTTRLVGCVSSEQRQHLIFRSMVRVVGQSASSNLRYRWSFSDAGPFDVLILDMDDEESARKAQEQGQGVVVLLGGEQQPSGGQGFTLSKPLRGNAFLQLLQSIESAEFESRAPAETAVLANGLAESAARNDALISLVSWPDLPRLPGEVLHDAARICALLSVQPCRRERISHFLDISPDAVNRVLNLISACAVGGDIQVLREHGETPSLAASDVSHMRDSGRSHGPSSFLSKIWNRLKGAA